MDWPSLLVGSAIGGIITWVVAYLYSRREEKAMALLPERITRELVRHGLIVAGRETEARAVAREALSSWGTTQTEMNQASARNFEQADLELRRTYERLRSILGPEDCQRLDEAQEAWRAFRDGQVKLAGGIHQGGTIQPLIHNIEAARLSEARRRELQQMYDDRRSGRWASSPSPP